MLVEGQVIPNTIESYNIIDEEDPEVSPLIDKSLLKTKLIWIRVEGDFVTIYNDQEYTIKILRNEDDYLYHLYCNNKEIINFEEWPRKWKQKDFGKRRCIIS